MQQGARDVSEELLKEYLERLAALQAAMDEPRDRLNEVKRDARSDGLNIDALNALLPLLIKYPHDKAAGVLNEMVRYARVFGAEFAVPEDVVGSGDPRDVAVNGPVSQPTIAVIPPPTVPRRRSAGLAPLRVPTLVLAAVAVSVGLIWLLN